jgi:hypothetical protein
VYCCPWARHHIFPQSRYTVSVDRRQLLQALCTGAIAFGSGCLGIFESRRPPYLEDITVRNGDDADHEFEFTIEQSESVVQQTTIELDRSESLDQIDCEWSGRGPFIVTCTLDGSRTETVRLDNRSGPIQQGTGEYTHLTFTATGSGELDWSGYLDDGGVQNCSGSPSE